MGLHIALLAAAARGHRKRHGNARSQRRLPAILRNYKAELRYKYDLLQLVKHCRRLIIDGLEELKPHWPEPETTDSARPVAHTRAADALPPAAAALIQKAKSKLGGLNTFAQRITKVAVEANRDSVDKRLTSEIHKAIGVNVAGLLGANGPLLQAMGVATQANVALIKTIPEQYFGRVTTTITDGWINGLRWEALVDQVQEDGNITERRAKLIARDQTAKMNSAFNQERQQQVGIERFEWSTSEDERVRPSHADLDGQVFDWDSPPTVDGEQATPGTPINCFPAESEIQFAHAVEKAYRLWYSGELVEVVTASGKSLRGTPNHPVLTARGWVGLGALNQGDHIVEVSDEIFHRIEKHHNDRVPCIADVFHAAAGSGAAVSVRGAVDNFHGDGADGQVDVVSTARPLFVDLVTPKSKGSRQFSLAVTASARSCARALQHLVFGARHATHGLVSSLSKLMALVRAQPLHALAIGCGYSTNLNPSFEQTPAHHSTIATQSLRDGLFAFAGQIRRDDRAVIESRSIVGRSPESSICLHADGSKAPGQAVLADADELGGGSKRLPFGHQLSRVVYARRFDWQGHVFNLQTAAGWYVTEGIVTRNCRCVAIPIVQMDELALGDDESERDAA